VWTYSMNKRHGHAEWPCVDMQHGQQHGQAAWTCSKDMQLGHAAWTCCMDMQQGHAAWTCSMEMQHEHAAWTCSMDLYMFIHVHGQYYDLLIQAHTQNYARFFTPSCTFINI
jgi:hypothetical protein